MPNQTRIERRFITLRRSKPSAQPSGMSPAVAMILGDETYYGDNPPEWLEGRNQRPCQTAGEAIAARKRLVKRLERFGRANAAARAARTRRPGSRR